MPNSVYVVTIEYAMTSYQRVFNTAEKAVCTAIIAGNDLGYNMKRPDRYGRKIEILKGGIGKAVSLRFTGNFHIMIECLEIE